MSYNFFRYGCSRLGFPTSGGSSAINDLGKRQNGINTIDYLGITDHLNVRAHTDSFSTLFSEITDMIPDATLWATPVRSNCFMDLHGVTVGTNDVTDAGKYNKDAFDNASGNHSIKPSDFPGCTKGCIWYAMSIFIDQDGTAQDFLGTVYFNFRQLPADGTNGLKEIFHPAGRGNHIEAFVVHGNGSTEPNKDSVLHSDIGSGSLFSRTKLSGGNGYWGGSGSDFDFTNDNGVWGYRLGSMLCANQGPYLDASTEISFGVQANGATTDSNVNVVHWQNTEYASQLNWKALLWTVFE
jgi:hypothetical protein